MIRTPDSIKKRWEFLEESERMKIFSLYLSSFQKTPTKDKLLELFDSYLELVVLDKDC